MSPDFTGSLLLAAILSVSPAQKGRDALEPPAASPLSQAVVKAHNQERDREGLPPLTVNARLVEAAQSHARDLADREKLSHEGADGSTPDQRIKKAGYQPRRTGENVAKGQDTVEEVMKGWMASPNHRRNILGDFREIGVAVAKDAEGQPYWVVDFGKPIPKLDPKTAAEGVVSRINQARSEAKRPKLAAVPALSEAARALADEQARASISDQRGSASRAVDLVREHGYQYRAMAQQVASGYPTPEKLVEGLLQDESRKSPLLGDFQDIGVGYAQDADGIPFWVILMASPQENR